MKFSNSVDDQWRFLFETKVNRLSIPAQYYLFRMFVMDALARTPEFSLDTKCTLMTILNDMIDFFNDQIDEQHFYRGLLMDLQREKQLREQEDQGDE